MQGAMTRSHLCPYSRPPHLAGLSRAVSSLSLRSSVEPVGSGENRAVNMSVHRQRRPVPAGRGALRAPQSSAL